MKRIVIFTGAGVSAESGVKTFRDYGGLWENHRVEDVASIGGFRRDPQVVWDFYRARHKQLAEVQPNAAHYAIAELEAKAEALGWEVTVVTQNVDRLHHKAGSKNVYELHGNLLEVKCSRFPKDCHMVLDEWPWEHETIPICQCCGSALRPNIVWFGEALPERNLAMAGGAASRATHFISIGTSAEVYPAAEIPFIALSTGAMVYEINPKKCMAHGEYHPNYKWLEGRAGLMVPALFKELFYAD